MPQPNTINELKWTSLTPAINEMKSPASFLRDGVFNQVTTLPTEDIEIGLFTHGRNAAPFVKKNGEALLVDGHGETFQTVQAPNIRLKRPFTPSELLFKRRPGTVIFSPGANMQVSALQAHIARDLQVMADMIVNAEEYLSALALRGQINYQVAPNENFRITYPKPAGHNINADVFWDDPDPALPEPEIDFMVASQLVSEEVSLGITDCIMGTEAAFSFLRIAKRQDLLNKLHVSAGNVTLMESFRESGAIFLGTFTNGIRCWHYPRQVTVGGTAIDLIRPKYVEFVAASPAAQFTRYYGAIPDMRALQGRVFQGQRFSKSWEIEDPSSMIALVHSRGLPVPRRPGAMLSMKVVSG